MSADQTTDVVTIADHPEAAVVTVHAGQLTNLQTVDTFAAQLLERIGAHKATHFIVDFGGVTFIVTPAVNALLQASKQVASRGGKMIVVGLNENIRRVFQLMKLDRVLLLQDDIDAARADLTTSGGK